MRIKAGDKVRLIAGRDKGFEGTVLKALPKEDKVIVEGANIHKRHKKASQMGGGGIEEFPAPIHISNVQLIDPSTNELTKVGYRFEDGKKVRFSKKTNNTLN